MDGQSGRRPAAGWFSEFGTDGYNVSLSELKDRVLSEAEARIAACLCHRDMISGSAFGSLSYPSQVGRGGPQVASLKHPPTPGLFQDSLGEDSVQLVWPICRLNRYPRVLAL